ncbi:family with sequence similarity 177 member A1 [Homo sapiens]|uniref:Family with sequence similarity 177 member A1 n=1 Tax=Homo sapiens TaxID=9606 RepID=A0A087X212_HUMAN|nr:family with sequence similarity 177 member A1 [Homo sapiens]KAI4060593.1 family with sequence similarity 177 member A1 [Homo sapiens]
MEVGLPAITLFLTSASSPVVATTMDQEPVGGVERGEAVAASGAAAAAAFGESAGQNLTLLPRLKFMARSRLAATSTSRVQAILLPQPPV